MAGPPGSGDPCLLFFTGGTALRKTTRCLKRATRHSLHVVTPFDSGGSSAGLRRALAMPAVGDLRNRLLALADDEAPQGPEIVGLLSRRLPQDEAAPRLQERLADLAAGRDGLLCALDETVRTRLQVHFTAVSEALPRDFDLRGASLGNLAMAGAWLQGGRSLSRVAREFGSMLRALGRADVVCEEDLHLAAELADGSRVVGQHRLSGKGPTPLGSPIRDLWLVQGSRAEAAAASAAPSILDWIRSADLICYPMGSFYTSVIANLLPAGVGRAICASAAPKIHIFNPGRDPEQTGMTLSGAIAALARFVRRETGRDTPIDRVVTAVLVDTLHGRYDLPLDLEQVRRLGVQVIDGDLADGSRPRRLDPGRVADRLLELAAGLPPAG